MNFIDLLYSEFIDSKKISLSSLEELDFLIELFSFFDEFDVTISRQVCRWWNDLLSKDTQTINQISINEHAREKKIPCCLVHLGEYKNVYLASYFGYLSILIWFNNSLSATTATSRNFFHSIFTYFYPSDNKKSINICNWAASGGQLTALKWARKNGYPWSSATSGNATENKDKTIRILIWLKRGGCDFNSWTTLVAAARGNLDVLRWLRENGCEWDDYVCLHSRQFLEIQEYIHGLPINERPCSCDENWNNLQEEIINMQAIED
jgi:hypothetical protein